MCTFILFWMWKGKLGGQTGSNVGFRRRNRAREYLKVCTRRGWGQGKFSK